MLLLFLNNFAKNSFPSTIRDHQLPSSQKWSSIHKVKQLDSSARSEIVNKQDKSCSGAGFGEVVSAG